MPATTNQGFRYLDPTDPPDLALATQMLATDVDAKLTSWQQARQTARTLTMSVPDSTFSPIAFYDGGSPYYVGTIGYGSGVLAFTVPGLYRWNLTVTWPATTTTAHNRQQMIYLNGSLPPYEQGRNTWTYYGSTGTFTQSGGGDIAVAAGDTLQAVLYHTFGSALTVSPKVFSVVRIA